jgi:hypothetical protein
VLRSGLRVGVLDALDQGAALGLLAQRAGDEHGLLVPAREVVGAPDRAGDRRRDGGELAVVGPLDARVRADDQVRAQRGDPLELEPVLVAQDGRLGGAQRPAGPRPDRVGLLAVPLRGGDRLLAEREHDVLLGEADHGDAPRIGGHGGRAEAVCHGDREHAGAGGGWRSVAIVGRAASGQSGESKQGRESGSNRSH